MADTSNAIALGLLKASLGYFGSELDPAVESHLNNLLSYAARALLEDCGIPLNPGDIYDDQLQAMYAAWLYRKGAAGLAKPPMLQTAIRNRQVGDALTVAALDEEVAE